MLNVLNGLDPRTVSRIELQAEVARLKAAKINLEIEIGMRNKDDGFQWGFKHNVCIPLS